MPLQTRSHPNIQYQNSSTTTQHSQDIYKYAPKITTNIPYMIYFHPLHRQNATKMPGK
uniref:Uncharacterized protein n=1 Tax=Podoviridae sp. ctdDI2 TaxID=2826567 RepID=A0A8S5NQU7_9CAUD|nr:MAG TPA: hypothetical protein [Podoviridae sp. ctdDI2]